MENLRNKQTVVLYFYSLKIAGGAERQIIALADLLSDKYNVVLVTWDNINDEAFYPLETRVVWRKLGSTSKGLLSKITRLKNLFEVLQRTKPSAMVGFVMAGDAVVYAAAILARVKIIVAERNSPAMYFLKYSFFRRIKIFALLHLSHKIVTQFQEFVPLYPRTLQRRAKVISNIVPSREIVVNVGSRNADGRYVMLGVQRLDGLQKRPLLLLRAFNLIKSEIPLWDLHLVGSGAELENIRSFVFSNDLTKRVQIFEETEKVGSHYQNANLFVTASKWEGFSNAVVEAMSLGIPCVGYSKSSGISQLIKGAGWLADGLNNENDLASAIIKACECGLEREKRGQKAIEMIKNFREVDQTLEWEAAIFDD